MQSYPLNILLLLSWSSPSVGFVKESHSRPTAQPLFVGQGPGWESSPLDSHSSGSPFPYEGYVGNKQAAGDFFSSNEEWKPLFRSIALDSSAAGMGSLNAKDIDEFKFDDDDGPWKCLAAIPTKDEDRAILAGFLDKMQAGLIEMPVDESECEGQNDARFIEEGRRLLVLSRFQVVQGLFEESIDRYNDLFSTCWSEIAELAKADEKDTGSLILVPGVDISNLQRFTETNLRRPLQWLGIGENFEVESFESGSPAIRLIHKLSDIPPRQVEDIDATSFE